MKNRPIRTFALLLSLLATAVFTLSACGTGDTASTPSTPASTTAAPTEKPAETTYYVGASWCGYAAADKNNAMKKLDGYDDVYYLEVTLTEDNADPTYGGHFYKVTDGTWDANGTWGSEQNMVKTAPVHPDGAGLGSVYIDRNGTFTIYFNAKSKQLFDTSSVPRVYGDFNQAMGRGENWGFENDALLLLDLDFDGKFEGTYTFPPYEGEAEGYSLATCTTIVYYDEWSVWGVGDQYLLDGTAGGMGKVSYYKPEKKTEVTFSYDPASHVTTIEEKAV